MFLKVIRERTSVLEEATENSLSTRGHRLLLRGESAVAFIGAALAAIMVIAFAAGVIWTLNAERDSVAEKRLQQIEAVGHTLAQSAESLMSADELSALRTLLSRNGGMYELTECRITLPDGQVVADLDAAKITLDKLPRQWQGPAGGDPTIAPAESHIAAHFPLTVHGRGPARLDMRAAFETPGLLQSEAQVGLAAIGAVALIALLIVYRQTRTRLRALGAIRESLLAMHGGEQDSGALTLSQHLGAEASAWNTLLADRETLRKRNLAERAQESLIGRAGGDLRGACDAISQGMLLVDEKLVVRYVNGAAAVFLQTTKDKLTGMSVANFVADEKVLEALRGAATGESRKRCTVEVEQNSEHGRGVMRYHVRPVRRTDAAAAMVLIEDITQQRVADEARNQFVAQATHELRTPLTNIRLYIETALDEGEKDAELRNKALNVINSETARLERIVDDMLKVAEIEAGSLKINHDDVHLDQVLGDLLHDYEKQAQEKGIALAFNLPPKLPVIQADRDKLLLAMHNLVGNALKYTGSGGRIAVNVDVTDDTFTFEVRDTGFGISDEDQLHIFDRFYRAQDKRVGPITGTGLGLALARDVIRLHGGDIAVESQLDKGSTFTMTVPTTAEAA